MTLRTLLLASSLLACPAAALADPPSVAASIKPVHSLVSAVMEGVAEPALIVPGTGSEHVYSMRPSDAEALEDADLVFWIGQGLETFLEKPLETLAAGATVVPLAETPGLMLLPFREGGPFEAHGHHAEGEEAEHEHGHAAKDDDHAHEETDHAHEEDEHGHHAYAGNDMHVWLDPENAKILVDAIAKQLSEADPENAERYAANAQDYSAGLDALSAELEATLAPVKDRPFVVFHDAYQYFETRFGLNAAGSITVSPENTPGAQRIAEIQAKVQELGATCVFSEPQFEPSLVAVVTEGTAARTGVLDPLGADIAGGPDLYPTLMRNMAEALASCLSNPS